jgi:ribosomal protein S16
MVVADSRMRRDGRFIEVLGHYDPMSRPETIEFSEEKIQSWIQKDEHPGRKFGKKELDGKVGIVLHNNIRVEVESLVISGVVDRPKH